MSTFSRTDVMLPCSRLDGRLRADEAVLGRQVRHGLEGRCTLFGRAIGLAVQPGELEPLISSLLDVYEILANAASEPSPLIPPAHYHQFRELIRSLGNPADVLKWFNDPNSTAYPQEPTAPFERLALLLALAAEHVQRSTTAAEMGASTTRRINALQWRPHDCLGGNFDDPSTTAAIISCSKAHDWEVAGVVTDMTQSLGIQGPELTAEERQMMSDACFEQARMHLPGLVLESPYSRYAGMMIMPTHESWLAGDRRLACLIAPHSRADLSQPPVPVQSTGPTAPPTVEALPVGTCVDLAPQGWHVVGCASSHTHQVVGNVPAMAEQRAQVQACFDLVAAALDRSPSSDDIELLSAKQDVLAAGLAQLPCAARSG